MLGPTGLKNREEKELKGLGTFLLSHVLTQLWLVVSGVVYSDIEL